MPALRAEPEATGGRRSVVLAVAFFVVAVVTSYLPGPNQQQIASAIRTTALRPFITIQRSLVAARLRAADVDVLRARLDSLVGVLSTMGALEDENRTLRSVLSLKRRIGPDFRPAELLRPGTPGSESMFILDLGASDGVRESAPVVDREGLVGVIREVRSHTSVGIDWTHPDFRASGMLADGTAYGMVENRHGAFREEDRLLLNGVAYHATIPDGTPVLTSGLGGVFPRGIPIGRIDGVAEAEAQWRKSYWVAPMVQPGSVTHVLVAVGESVPDDVSDAWPLDSLLTREQILRQERARADSLRTLADSVRVLQNLLDQARARGEGGT